MWRILIPLLFIFQLFSDILYSQNNCNIVNNSAAIQSVRNEINGTIDEKIINVYWHIVRKSNHTTNNPISFFQSLIDKTTMIYEQHSIKLRTCYYDLDLNTSLIFHDNDDLYSISDFGQICSLNSLCLNDGLNVFLIEKSEQGKGEAAIRGNHCWVSVSSIEESVPVIVHEIGHCFGLFHTTSRRNSFGTHTGNHAHTWHCDEQGDNGDLFSGSPISDCNGNVFTPTERIEKVDGSNGGISADFVVDTPSDILVNLQDCEVSPYTDCSSINGCQERLKDEGKKDQNCKVLTPDWFNYMQTNRGVGSSKCLDHFTNGQVKRIHGVISQFLSYMLLEQEPTPLIPCTDCYVGPDNPCFFCTQIPHTNVTLTQNGTFTQPMVHGTVFIKSPAIVTINSKIEFSPTSSIIVEFGAKLILDGATLTKCPISDNWKGIKVKADFTYVWGFGPPNTEVILKNGAIIEYAETGIDAVDQLTFFNTSDIGGAKITIEGNSSISNCEIGVRLGPIYGYQELSSIDNATFNNNEIGVQINSNNGLIIKNSTFKYNNHLDIQGISSSMVADNNTFNTSIEFSSNYPIFTGSNFKNNDFFVQNGTITNTTGGAALSIDAMSNSIDFYIQNNQFFGTGLQIIGELDFEIRNNDFHDVPVGTWISESGDNNNNFVVANNFYGNDYANSASGINDTEYEKNCFNSTEFWDIEVNDGASIHEAQGTVDDAAGNCFSKHIGTASTAEHFNYYIIDTLPQSCRKPGNAGNFSEILSENDVENVCGTGNNIYSTIPARYRDCTYTNSTDLKQMITYLRNEILLLESNTNIDPWIKKWLIAKYKRCLDRAIKLKAKDDLQQKGKDSTIVFLLSQPEFRYQSMAYGLVMENNDLTRASTILNNLPINEFSEQEFVNVQNTYLDYLSSRSNYVLSSTNNSLIYNAGLRKHPLAGFARTVYHTITGQKIPVTLTHMNGNPNIRAKEVVKPDISIFPNPSENGEFNIKLASFTEGDEIVILVYNMYGQVIQSNPLTQKQTQMEIPNASNGIYFIQIMINNTITHSGKLIVK